MDVLDQAMIISISERTLSFRDLSEQRGPEGFCNMIRSAIEKEDSCLQANLVNLKDKVR
jgi:hypothetical protein